MCSSSPWPTNWHGSHGLCCERSGLSGSSRASRRLAKQAIEIKFSHRGLHRISKDERTVKTAYLKPDCRIGPYTAEAFCRTQVRGVSHHGQETDLHLKAGYIDADIPSSINFSLAFRRRTIHFGKFDRAGDMPRPLLSSVLKGLIRSAVQILRSICALFTGLRLLFMVLGVIRWIEPVKFCRSC